MELIVVLIIIYLTYILGKCAGKEQIKKTYAYYDLLDVYDVILSHNGNQNIVIDKPIKR